MINMDTPMGDTPLDRPGGLLGQPLDRIDGPAKVSGAAPYAYEYKLDGKPTYGFLALSTIGSGSLLDIDTAAAEAAPGVLLVLTYKTMPAQAEAGEGTAPQLAGPTIRFQGQPIALVVAETFEAARAAARLVRPRYAEIAGTHDFEASVPTAAVPKPRNGTPPDTDKGDVEAAYAAAPVQLDVRYDTPVQSHAMMEPHATVASWDGSRLTLYSANQNTTRGAAVVAETLKLPKGSVRMVSRYVGGGFGAKLQPQADAVLAGAAAMRLGRPVKLALTRPQVFPVTTNRSATRQRIRLAAQTDGTLLAVIHEAWSANTPGQSSFETAAQATRNIYATPNLRTAHRLSTLELPVSSAMRAPGEAVGLLALECAMDELAERLGMDPIELRLKNEPTADPQSGKPFTTRALVPCLRQGAQAFGWSRRGRPGETRDGEWLVGLGVAAAIRGNPMNKAEANATLGPDGRLLIATSMTDIGTGSYTILAQIAADMLGLPLSAVTVQLGDSDLPLSPGSGGSFGANSAGSAVYDACNNLRAALLAKAGLPADARFEGGSANGGGQSVPLARLVAGGAVSAHGAAEPGQSRKEFAQQSFGAHFAEVGVNEVTGEIRLRRMLGVFTAGRILNRKTARSQAIGGMVFGVGAALMEEVAVDTRDGLFVNNNLAEYHVATHADVPQIEAVFIDELDPRSSAMKSKGLGELGICGAGAAVANAVFNASGVRIRDYPLTLDKVLDAWSRPAPQQRTER